jgi:hypothetical protein
VRNSSARLGRDPEALSQTANITMSLKMSCKRLLVASLLLLAISGKSTTRYEKASFTYALLASCVGIH